MRNSMMDDSGTALLSMDIDRFTRLGHDELQRGNLVKAIDAFIFAFKQAKQLDDDYLERSCAFNLGAVYIASKKPEKGLEVLQRAVPPMNKRDGSSNGDLYYNFGLGYEALKNRTEMTKYFQMALEEYELEKNHEMIAALSKKIAQTFSKESRHKEAADCFGKAAKAYSSLFLMEERIHMLSCRTQQLLKSGDKRECLPTLDECLMLCQKLDNTSKQVKLYGELGLSFTQCGDYVKASKCFREALQLVRLVKTDKKKEAVIIQNLGAVYNSLGQYEEALTHHSTAAAAHAELGNRGAQGQCFSNAAYSYTQLGDNESAGEFYLHALQAAKDAGDKHGEWQAMEGLGAVAFNRGLTDRAVQYFNKALVILSGCEQNQVAQERIVGKLTDAIQFKVAKAAEGLPPLPVSRSDSKKSINSVPVSSIKREISRTASARPPSIASLPTKSSTKYAPAPLAEQEGMIRLLVNDERPSTKEFKRPDVPLTRRQRKVSDAGILLPEHGGLGLSEYESDTDMSLISSRRPSRDSRLSDQLDGMIKQFREDRKGRRKRPATARPERRKKGASLTNQDGLMRARQRDLVDQTGKNVPQQAKPRTPRKEERAKRRFGQRRPISPSAHHEMLSYKYERPLLRTSTFNSREDYRNRMKRIVGSESDIDWEYLNRIGPKPISPSGQFLRGRSFTGEEVKIFSSQISESSSTSITGTAETTGESESETATITESDEETIEEHQDNLPTSFNRDSIRYARTSEEYRRMMKERREAEQDDRLSPSRGSRPLPTRPSDKRRPYSGRPASGRNRAAAKMDQPHREPSPRAEPLSSPQRQPSPIEESSPQPEPVPASIPLPSPQLEMAPMKPESPRDLPPVSPRERPPSRERFEKRMMEHMEAEKSAKKTNRTDSLDSAQSSSVGDTSSQPNSNISDPVYEDALPVGLNETPAAVPADVPTKPTSSPILNQSESLATTGTEKLDNNDLEMYRRKLERRDASLDGSEITGSEFSESGSSYSSSDSRTLTADEEPPYDTIKTDQDGTPPPVPPPLNSTYEEPKVRQPGPNFFNPDAETVSEEKTPSIEDTMGESGLYDSIRTGKFDATPPSGEVAEAATSTAEETSEPLPPPRPPNIQNMSRAEKEKALFEYQRKRDEYLKRRSERRNLQQMTAADENDDQRQRVRRSRMCVVM